MPLALVVAAVVGIRVGEHLGPAPAVGVLALGLLVGGTAMLVRRSRGRLALAVVAVALVGVAATQRALDGAEHSPLTRPRDSRATATVTATLVDDPHAQQYTARVLARVTRVGERSGGSRTVLVTAGGDVASRLRLAEAGDEVRLSGWLAPLTGYDTRLRWKHVVARFDAVELRDFEATRSPLLAIANRFRDRVLAGSRRLPSTEGALAGGFLLGDTRGLPREVEEEFRTSGLTHLLVVSGENVAFVLAVFRPVLRRLSLRTQLVGGLGVLLLFGTMTRWEPSVLRSCAMAACSMTALYLGRPTPTLRVLALAVVTLLLADPFLLHSIGFMLSCGACAGIAVLAAPVAARLPGPRWFREPFSVTLAAQTGVAPVLIPVFGSVPLASLPANVLAAPVVGPLTIFGLVTGVAGGLIESSWPGLATVLQAPTGLLARLVLEIAAAFSHVPVDVDARTAWAVVAVIALLAAVRRGSNSAMRPRRNLRVDAPLPSR